MTRLGEDLRARCKFPPPSDGPVTLAVSGGPDSMALMVLAAEAGLSGRAVHVDHGLRTGSDTEADLVAEWAAKLGFGFELRRLDLVPGGDLEARARAARYAVLPPDVLTGHTMDDQAETVLLNLLRGAALDGLSGMRPPPDASPAPPGSRQVRRPLIALRRAETLAVCEEAAIEPVVDPTNDDGRFRRNRIRRQVLPLLCEVADRDVVPVLARQAAIAADDVALLEQMASRIDPSSVHALRGVPEPLVRRALRSWLRWAPGPAQVAATDAHPPSWAEIERVMEVVRGERRACELTGGRRVERRAGILSVRPGTLGATAAPVGR